ncbi:hypothetical protein LCGC14_0375660 [marine sediment metagenome]|uniref:Uncharacterized protein n=1 Tax=marine sediment metagenome TaxID=412755 RepID=A0A0F9WCF0_9ZZZZ
MYGNAEQTVVDSYNIVDSVTGSATDTFPTSFPFTTVSGDMNLLLPSNGGKGTETQAYRLEILITGQPAGSATVIVAGASEGGPIEQIASLAVTIGSVVETGDWRIADTMVLGGTAPIHLAACSTLVADSGNSRPAKFAFDAIGYRFIKFYVISLTTTTDIRIYARHF